MNGPSNKEKMRISARVRRAWVAGRIPGPVKCAHCGVKDDLCGHHPDYSKPLEVIWLCRRCHINEHRRINSALKRAV